jgi:RHS repeat-associated protein
MIKKPPAAAFSICPFLDRNWSFVSSFQHTCMTLSRLCRNVALLIVITPLFSGVLLGQFVEVNNMTATPVPGAGHDYVHLLNETVNPANGSLSLRLTTPMPSGRQLGFPFAFSYDSNGVFVPASTALWVASSGYMYSAGWSYSLPSLTYSANQYPVYGSNGRQIGWCDIYVGYVFRDATSGNNLLSLANSQCKSQSYLTGGNDLYRANISSSNINVAAANGTVYTFGSYTCVNGATPFLPGPGGNVPYASSTTPSTIEDSNGNTISFSPLPAHCDGSFSAQDTVGRTVLSSSGFGATGNRLTVAGYSQPYSLTWGTTTANPPMSGSYISGDAGCNTVVSSYFGQPLSVITSITLPNGQAYNLYYDPTYGLLNKIVYPGGGYVRYSWGNLSNYEQGTFVNGATGYLTCTLAFDRYAIAHRYVSYDGSFEAEEQDFQYSESPSSLWTSRQTIVTTHDNVRGTVFTTTYNYVPYTPLVQPYLEDTLGPIAPTIPLESTIVYNDVGGTTLDTVTKGWFDDHELACEMHTLSNGTSGKFYAYSAGAETSDIKEYDYGQLTPSACYTSNSYVPPTLTPVRETATGYHSFPATPIFATGASMFDRPNSVIVYDHGNRLAETDYGYDQASVTAVSPLPLTAHDENNYSSSYNNRGNLTTKTVKCLQTGCTDAITTLVHDETGQTTSVTDPCGNATCGDMAGTNHTTVLSYADHFSSGTPPANTNAFLTSKTDPLGHSQTFVYSYGDGQLTSAADENGHTTAYIYNTPPSGCGYSDGLDRLSEVDYPDQGRSTYCYNDAPPSPSVTSTTLVDNSVNLHISNMSLMDGIGHVVQTQLTTDPEGTDKADTTFDGVGRVWKQSSPYRSTSDPTYGITVHNYDSLGRSTSVTQADGSAASTRYSGNCSTTTDESGKSRLSCSDALGRLTQVFEDPSGLNYETDYQYNVLDHVTGVTQKGGSSNSSNWRSRSFQYDSLSRLTSSTNPESGTITYSYDANGNAIQKTSPKPNQTNPATTSKVDFCYDALNRVTTKAYNTTACPPTSPVATYTYDQGTNGIGRRTGMTDGPGSASWTFDSMGRIASETRVTANVTKTTSYVYNQDGSVKTITYPSTRSLNYTYNGAGRVLSVVDPTGPINYITTAKYAPHGAPTTYLNGFVSGGFAGISTTNFYNARLQPCRLSATTSSVPTSCTNGSNIASVMDFRYDFHSGSGDNGNVFQIVNNRDGNRTQNFLYDSLNRIQQAYTNGPNWGETFGPLVTNPGTPPSSPGIDAWANLTNRSGVTGKTYYEGLNCPANINNQLTTCSLSYDAAGNVTSDGSLGYTYDSENRMTKFVTSINDIYTYDGDGQRVKKTTSSVTLYWYAAANVLDETSGTGTLFSEYIYFDGKRIARRDADNSVKYYFSDNLGSASVVTNSQGAMPPLAESDYYPYGGEIVITSGDSNHYKFTGKERDSESGLDNFGARYFTSSLGRFMTPDWSERPTAVPYAVFGDPQSLNLYTYVRNDPVSRADADGHCVNIADPGACTGFDIRNETGLSQDISAIQSVASASKSRPKPKPCPADACVTATVGGVDTIPGVYPGLWGTLERGAEWTIAAGARTAAVAGLVLGYLVSPPGQFAKDTIDSRKTPPPPSDPKRSPGPGWEWRGNGPPGSSEGSWYNPSTGESLHPDLNHPAPIGPHWDYRDPSGNDWRIFPDGSASRK